MLLEVVPLAGDVGRNLHAVGETDTSDLTDSRVRLAGSLRRHLHAHATLERSRVEGRAVLERVETTAKSHNLGLPGCTLAGFLGELVYGCHDANENSPVGAAATI